jgi:hypothetical protein
MGNGLQSRQTAVLAGADFGFATLRDSKSKPDRPLASLYVARYLGHWFAQRLAAREGIRTDAIGTARGPNRMSSRAVIVDPANTIFRQLCVPVGFQLLCSGALA